MMVLPTSRCLVAAVALASLGSLACQSAQDRPEGLPPVALLERADRSFDQRAYGPALEAYRLAALTARSDGDAPRFTEATAQVASVLALQGLPSEARTWLAQAEAAAAPDEPLAWTRVLLAQGLVLWKEERAPEALGCFSELFQYCFLHGQTARAIQASQLATLVSEGPDQIEWARRGIETAAAAGKPAWEAPLWENLGWLLAGRGLADDAVDAFAKALALTRQSDSSRFGRARAEWALAHAQLEAGRNADAQDGLDALQPALTGLYAKERTPAVAEYLGRTLLDLARLDLANRLDRRAEERLVSARARLVEAGALEGAPRLIDEVDRYLAEVRARRPSGTGRVNGR